MVIVDGLINSPFGFIKLYKPLFIFKGTFATGVPPASQNTYVPQLLSNGLLLFYILYLIFLYLIMYPFGSVL